MKVTIAKRSLASVLQEWQPGDHETWQASFLGILQVEAERMQDWFIPNVRDNGIRVPILLGNDGRVWNGHHRLYAALQLGLTWVPVVHSAQLYAIAQESPSDYDEIVW